MWGFPACSLLLPPPRSQHHPAPQLRLSKPSRDDNYSRKCSIFTFGQYFEKRKSAPFPNICDAMVAGKWCLPTFDKKRVPGQRCRSKRRPCCAILLQLCKVHTTTNWLELSGARFVQLWGCADANGATQDLYQLSTESSLAFLQTNSSDHCRSLKFYQKSIEISEKGLQLRLRVAPGGTWDSRGGAPSLAPLPAPLVGRSQRAALPLEPDIIIPQVILWNCCGIVLWLISFRETACLHKQQFKHM